MRLLRGRRRPGVGANIEQVLPRVGFTDHSIARFVERAGLEPTRPDRVEQIIRELLGREGRVTTERPRWARSHNTAALYLQVGEWMLFILEPDRRRADHYACVTVVNGPEDNDWEHALARGYIHTPPPPELAVIPRQRPGLWDSLRIAQAHRRGDRRQGSLLAHTLSVHRSRRRRAQGR
jgi:hypothetical protein